MYPVKGSDLFSDSNHNISDIFQDIMPGTVFFVYIVFFFFWSITKLVVKFCKMERFYDYDEKIMNI